jgi:hypothetical protein
VGAAGAGDFACDCRVRLAMQRTQDLREQMLSAPAEHPEAQTVR